VFLENDPTAVTVDDRDPEAADEAVLDARRIEAAGVQVRLRQVAWLHRVRIRPGFEKSEDWIPPNVFDGPVPKLHVDPGAVLARGRVDAPKRDAVIDETRVNICERIGVNAHSVRTKERVGLVCDRVPPS